MEVWRLAKDLSVQLYLVTKRFKQEDKFSIGEQIKRSAISIPSNIAEGSGRGSDKEFVRFIMIALGSWAELRTQLEIARDIGILATEKFEIFDEELDKIGRMLKNLEKTIRTRIK